jgi:hypothetical protein
LSIAAAFAERFFDNVAFQQRDGGGQGSHGAHRCLAVAQNEKEKAPDIANKAVAAGPNSGAALIALSYAHQANFDPVAVFPSIDSFCGPKLPLLEPITRASKFQLSLQPEGAQSKGKIELS